MGKLVPKLIQLDEKQKEELEKLAKEKYMTSNQLVRVIIDEYLKKEV